VTDLEDQVRAALRSASDHVEMPPEAGREAWRRATRRDRRDRALTIGAIAAVAVLVIGILAFRTTTERAPIGPAPSVSPSGPSPSAASPSASYTICTPRPTSFGYRIGNGTLQPLGEGAAVDADISVGQTLTVEFAGKCASGGLLFRQDPTDSHNLIPVGSHSGSGAIITYTPQAPGDTALALSWTACRGWVSCPAPTTLARITLHTR
jgi:hypothetical protein